MPSAAPYVHACGAVVPHGQRCPTCTRAHDQARGSASARGYDVAWQRLRGRFLQVHPWCSAPGCNAKAAEVDHIVPISVDPSKRLVWGNLRALCKSHHSQRTMTDLNTARAAARVGER
jgi:5-methylcytosine-specific restriction enzyme A